MAGVIPEKDYYRRTLHTKKYVADHWSRYFQILDFLPAWLGHQDLVILRKD